MPPTLDGLAVECLGDLGDGSCNIAILGTILHHADSEFTGDVGRHDGIGLATRHRLLSGGSNDSGGRESSNEAIQMNTEVAIIKGLSSGERYTLVTVPFGGSLMNGTYIFTTSPSASTISSSLARGELWQMQLFTEMHVGNAMPGKNVT